MLKKIFRKKNIPIFIIICLLIWIASLYAEISSQKYDELYMYSYVPHLDLSNIQFESSGEYLVYVTGFVKFDNVTNQPRGLWQYQIIEPSNRLDENGNRIYLLTDVIKMNYIPPRKFDPVDLKVIQDTDSTITLTDEGGNLFLINKSSKSILMKELGGDSSSLITNQNDYKDFMKSLLE